MALWHYTVDLSWPGTGSPGVNVWDIRTDEGLPGDNLQEAVDAIKNFYASTLLAGALVPTGYRAVGRALAVEINTKQIDAVTGFTTNTNSSDPEFAGPLMLICTLRTSSATRKGRGRKFIGPAAQGTLDADGTPTTGAVTALQTACTELLAASTANSGWAVGVYSQTDGLFRDMVQMQARNYFAILRSRRD
jgi:hypothetical protein